MASAGCMLAGGQPVTRTVPPLTTAAARNGTALDRSGSMSQCRAAIGPGATRQRLACVSSTSTPASRSIATVIAMCGADGTRRAGVHDGQAVGERRRRTAAGRRRTATTPTRRSRPCRPPPPRRRAPGTADASPSMSTPSPRSASSSGAIGRVRACSSPSNVDGLGCSARPPAGRTAAPCRPARSRRGRPAPGRWRR